MITAQDERRLVRENRIRTAMSLLALLALAGLVVAIVGLELHVATTALAHAFDRIQIGAQP